MDIVNLLKEKKGIISLLTICGFAFLAITLLCISAPRSWALYPLGLFLASGLGLWIVDFRKNLLRLKTYLVLILPPVIYFIIHLLSIIFQGGEIILLENRLMFLLVPIFGLPVFCSELLKQHITILFKALSVGLFIVSVFLLSRAFCLAIIDYSGEIPIFQYLRDKKDLFFFTNFSVFEHPTYLAMKLNWVIILLTWFKSGIIKNSLLRNIIICLFSAVILLLASKSGIILWSLIIAGIFIISIRKKEFSPIYYLVSIPLFLIISYLLIVDIDRMDSFLNSMKIGLGKENIDWKNLDHRTREWYSALQLIKDEPITGIGLAEVENRMVSEYVKHDWKDEAFFKFNAHNQFLEAQMTFGIAGSVSLLLMLLSPLIFRKKLEYPRLTTVFIFMMSFFLLFESMFNRQWGIMFFLLFYFILALPKQISEENIKPE